MQTHWQGHYLDGQTAQRHDVRIELQPAGLVITTESEVAHRWPYNTIRQAQGFYAGEQVRLEREQTGKNITEVLLVTEPSFLSALHHVAPSRVTHFHKPARRLARVQLTVLAGLLSIVIAAGLYFWGIPAMVAAITPYVPISWENRLGAAVVEHLVPVEQRCEAPEQLEAINRIIVRLTAPVSPQPYMPRTYIMDSPEVNALAVPGGYIVLFRGLLQKIETPEELAGVLAHEIQHILHRHGTRALLHHFSTALFLTLLAGDAGGLAAFGLEGANMLSTLQYSRGNEEQADNEGMRMLDAAEIDPRGMIAFFELLQQQENNAPGFFQYFSTHPSTADRIAKLRTLAAQTQYEPTVLLPGYDWQNMQSACRSQGRGT